LNIRKPLKLLEVEVSFFSIFIGLWLGFVD